MSHQRYSPIEAGLRVVLTIMPGVVIAMATLRWRSLAALFVSSDVALIYAASAAPLAFIGTRYLRHRAVVLAALLLCGGGTAIIAIATSNATGGASSTFSANMLRAIVAVSLAFSITLFERIFLSDRRIHRRPAPCDSNQSSSSDMTPSQCLHHHDEIAITPQVGFQHALAKAPKTAAIRLSPSDRPRSTIPQFITSLGLGILMLTLLPTVYVQARSQHEIAEFTNLIEQSRIGEARELIRTLTSMAPSTQIRGRPLDKVARELDREIQAIQLQVTGISPGTKSPEQRLHRCRLLAMLGHRDEALEELAAPGDTPLSPAASDLCGTIHETHANWSVALAFHHQAKTAWLHQPESPERTAGIFRATTRLAYCHRKLGAYDVAETEYRAALAQSPTADTHFLLAQFYEDMQQSTKARDHARQAMKLAPQRYQREGTQLINKLLVGHFGCLAVHRAEHAK